jgi:hypothetical protein
MNPPQTASSEFKTLLHHVRSYFETLDAAKRERAYSQADVVSTNALKDVLHRQSETVAASLEASLRAFLAAVVHDVLAEQKRAEQQKPIAAIRR